jgi:hypothetical protein
MLGTTPHGVRNLMKQFVIDSLIALIDSAFSTVTLGNGIGLFEAQALDNYDSDSVRARSRANDEMIDWSKINANDLNTCHSSMSYFDAESMRFHLPAFLIGGLKDTFFHDVVSVLTSDHHFYDNKFELFNEMQRHAVRQYLLFMLQKEHELGNKTGNTAIEDALKNKWPEWLFFTITDCEKE